MSTHNGWIGVDLDGTLAHYDHWRGVEHIGEPIEPMVARVKEWIAEGKQVKICTARVSSRSRDLEEVAEAHRAIARWCAQHLGLVLEITCTKDLDMYQLWDDRAVCVERNTGKILGQNPD